MYKRIMVAVDTSSTAAKALDEAVQLSRSVGASLCVVHAEDESLLEQHGMGIGTFIDVAKVEAAIREGGLDLLAKAVARAEAGGVKAESRLVESGRRHVPELIVECAADWQADLVIVGTHGRRGINRLLVGSVAEKLVRLANTSVMLVRE